MNYVNFLRDVIRINTSYKIVDPLRISGDVLSLAAVQLALCLPEH